MDEPEYLVVHDFIPVPKVFYPFLEDHPFEHCIVCNRDLLDDDCVYLIEKAFKVTEVICEYAMCNDCRMGLRGELSKESLMRIGAWCDERVDMAERRKKLLKVSRGSVEPWIDECILTKESRGELEAYQIYAECQGKDMLFSYCPFMIGSKGMEELAKLLSKKTKDCIDDFTGKYLGTPPELVDLPEDSLLFFP